MNSTKISVVKMVGKTFGELFGGIVNLDKIPKNDALTVQDDIRTFADGHLILRVLYGYPEPMFLVDDVIKIGIIKDPKTALDKAQDTSSSVFMTMKVNYDGFEDKEYVFTNFRGACAMAMSSFQDNPYQAAFSLAKGNTSFSNQSLMATFSSGGIDDTSISLAPAKRTETLFKEGTNREVLN